jgi:DNA-binding LacI/PurR family transcriptional regulator
VPSLRKLAELAGVNPSTVTRALRGDSRIGAETRARIKALAEQYHYLPNRLTQSLMTGTSHTIGLVLPSVVTPYSARLLSGVLHSATTAGYRILIRESFYQIAHSLEAIQMLIEQRVDGILLDCGHLDAIPRKTILELRSQHVIPVGLDATLLEGEIDHVHTDEQAMATQAVDYLVHLGHHRVAFVGQTVQGHFVGRAHYVRRALQQRMLSTRYFFDTKGTPPYEHLPAGDILAQMLALPTPPTALIAWEDPIAATLIKEGLRRGLRIPGDLSIIGFGNLAIADLITPTLTTFEQHPEQVGQHAVELLLARLNERGAEEPTPPCALAIRPTLVPRESCAAPLSR